MLIRNLRFPPNRLPSLLPPRLLKPLRQYRLPLLLLLLASLLEIHLHTRQYAILQPDSNLDPPFYTQCQEPLVTQARENATLVMLVRNKELDKALRTIQSVERHFNRWFHYPVVFLNDEAWTEEFMATMREAVSGEVRFDVLRREEWSFPGWMDEGGAKESIARQGRAGILYAGLESYHHMCRFYSGKFYTIPALQSYKWYWRIEPDVDFYCALTYDPFVEMARHKKVYGFTISLPEEKRTCPSLFRHMAEYKEAHGLPTTTLWKAMISASWAPWPFRGLMAWLFNHTDRNGDGWNMCHYWSNFEIADMDFFRGKEYQDLFEYLDRSGGFYHERWGDAAVHSLALAMLLDSQQVHHFQDIGYRHDWFHSCPANAPGDKQLPLSSALKANTDWAPEGRLDDPDAVGCRCECDATKGTMVGYSGYCTKRIKLPNRAKSLGTGYTLFDWL